MVSYLHSVPNEEEIESVDKSADLLIPSTGRGSQNYILQGHSGLSKHGSHYVSAVSMSGIQGQGHPQLNVMNSM
jgi:hypothetical protein